MKSKSIAKKEDEPVNALLILLLMIGILLIIAGICLVLFFHPAAGITCIVIGAIMVILYYILRGPIKKK